jgi:hypothetical protein
MRAATIALSFALILPNPLPAAPHLHRTPQQAAAASTAATPTLQQSLTALVGNTSLIDVTLTGSVHRIAGSDDETGTASLKAISSGATRVDLFLSAGPRSEISDTTATPPTGSWSGPDNESHTVAQHNLLIEPAWFFPTFLVARGLASSTYAATYVGHETRNSAGVEHVAIYKQLPAASGGLGIIQHLSEQDLYLDSSTLLPVAMTFNTHPDQITTDDIPMEIRFSDYRLVGGIQAPFRVQKYMNNSLILDLQIQSVAINTGLSASTFLAQ